MNSNFFKSVGLLILVLISLSLAVPAQEPPKGELIFNPAQRVIAHGNEFNDLTLSADAKRLLIASERGDVIVWNIAERRIEKRLNQGEPVHFVVALADPRYVVAAGSVHFGGKNAVVRKWNIETGEFTDWHGLDCGYFVMGLAVERGRDLVAAVAAEGCITVWNASTNVVQASWQMKQTPLAVGMLNDNVYVSSVDRKEFQSDVANSAISVFKIGAPANSPPSVTKQPGFIITHFNPAPDKRGLAVHLMDSRQNEQTALLDVSGTKLSKPFEGSAASWLNSNSLLLFDWLDPARIVSVGHAGEIKVTETFEHAMVKDDEGRAFNLTGQVTSPDGTRAWSVYDHGAELIEWDLKGHVGKKLITEHGGAYAISVQPGSNSDGLLLTGGADGYVRLWNFPDLSLRREFKIGADAAVLEAQLFPDGKRALVGSCEYSKASAAAMGMAQPPPVSVMILNLETGEQKTILTQQNSRVHNSLVGNNILHADGARLVLISSDKTVVREFVVGRPFLRYAVSPDQNWLAVLANEGEIYLFEIATGKISSRAKTKLELESPVAAGNDGHFVYAVSREEILIRWDTRTGEIKETPLTMLSELHDRSDFITLSSDGKQLVVCGSHSDLAILNPDTGDVLFYDHIAAGVWFVEKVWLSADRLVLTTDTGVMYSGKLEKAP